MPKYVEDKVRGYILYFTSKCVVEAMHVHASDRKMSEEGSAKLFVYSNGDTKVMRYGKVSERDMADIQKYIKNNYEVMYKRWRKHSNNGYYDKR